MPLKVPQTHWGQLGRAEPLGFVLWAKVFVSFCANSETLTDCTASCLCLVHNADWLCCDCMLILAKWTFYQVSHWFMSLLIVSVSFSGNPNSGCCVPPSSLRPRHLIKRSKFSDEDATRMWGTLLTCHTVSVQAQPLLTSPPSPRTILRVQLTLSALPPLLSNGLDILQNGKTQHWGSVRTLQRLHTYLYLFSYLFFSPLMMILF